VAIQFFYKNYCLRIGHTIRKDVPMTGVAIHLAHLNKSEDEMIFIQSEWYSDFLWALKHVVN
jgi:hypothetical protein